MASAAARTSRSMAWGGSGAQGTSSDMSGTSCGWATLTRSTRSCMRPMNSLPVPRTATTLPWGGGATVPSHILALIVPVRSPSVMSR